ncbi:MAG: hypothetical protein ABI794_03205 [Betaproteobacteria bacterium]
MPDTILGVWRRKLLRTPEVEDTASTVYWLQTSLWHGDIRVPVYRPPCSGKRSLAQCTHEELLDLSAQQGFAGTTMVEGDTCRWLRRVDFQPPSGFSDVGRIEFSGPDLMLEYGIEQEYFEIWERLPGSVGQEHVNVEFQAGDDARAARPTMVLLATGDHFIRVRPRRTVLPQADGLSSLTADDQSLRAALDFEISFGTRSGSISNWVIHHSTFPWREGERLGAG